MSLACIDILGLQRFDPLRFRVGQHAADRLPRPRLWLRLGLRGPRGAGRLEPAALDARRGDRRRPRAVRDDRRRAVREVLGGAGRPRAPPRRARPSPHQYR